MPDHQEHLPGAADQAERLRLLDRAAELCRIEPEYWDTWGNRHFPSERTKTAIVESLGGDCSTAGTLTRFLASRELEQWTRLIPPSIVAASSQPVLRVRTAGAEPWSEALLQVAGEAGGTQAFRCTPHEPAAAVTVEGRPFTETALRLPEPLAPGYYSLFLAIGSQTAAARLAITPERAYIPPKLDQGSKTAGVAVCLFGVRSARNWGCGDATDLRALLDWVAKDLHCSFLALNPLHAIDNRQPYNISPYLPNSIFFRNPIYIDVEQVPEVAASPSLQRLLRRPALQARLAALRDAEFVEYEPVWKLKKFFLALAYRRFVRDHLRLDTPRAAAFREFQRRSGSRLELFATYCALWDWQHRRDPEVWIWQDWPAACQDPRSPEVSQFRLKHRRRILFYAYLQWLIDEQLAAAQQYAHQLGMPIGLYHDLALATDRCGADLWAYREFYVAGCRVGSPPDGFAPEGQDWAFPPPDTLRNRDDGYQHFIDAIRASARHGGALRMDHVMRLFRLYWIPEGISAKDGAYVKDFHEDLLRVLALESVRGQFLVVGEDLGTVGGEVRELLHRYGILSYKVLFFEKNHSGGFHHPEHYPRQALVSSTTHDLPTLAGYWTNRDIEARRQAGLLPDEASYFRQLNDRANDKQRLLDVLHERRLLPDDYARDAQYLTELTGELHNAIIGFLVGSPSMLLVLNQEDLTKEPAQQNLPASTWQYPNWQRKMKYTVEQLRTLPIARDFSTMFRNWLIQCGRL